MMVPLPPARPKTYYTWPSTKKCSKQQYLGETENVLHIHLNGHRSNIKTRKMENPVAAHFNLPEHSMEDLTIIVIEKTWTEDVKLRK